MNKTEFTLTVLILLVLALIGLTVIAVLLDASAEADDMIPRSWAPIIMAHPSPSPTVPPAHLPAVLNCDTGFEQPVAGCWVEYGGAYPQRWCNGEPKLDGAQVTGYGYEGDCLLWQGGYDLATDMWDSEPVTIPDWASTIAVRLAWKVETNEQEPSIYDTCSLWVAALPDGYPAWQVFNHSNMDAGDWRVDTYVLAGSGDWRGRQIVLQFDAILDGTLPTNCYYDRVEVWGRP